MNNYRNEILNEFIDRYEKSSYYKGKSEKPRKISIVLHKKFPEYGHSFHYEETNELENIAFQLQSQGFVEFSKKSILGDRELILNQEENCLDRIYKELKRVPVKGKIIHYVKLLDQYHEEAFIKDFVDETRKLINIYSDESVENLFSIDNFKEDGKDFVETLVTLRTLENKVDTINETLEKLFSYDKIMTYIDSADSYYKDYYKELMISEARDIYVSLINDMKNIFKFLSKNKDKWNIEDDTIVFENDEYLDKYNELIEKIGKIEENGQNI